VFRFLCPRNANFQQVIHQFVTRDNRFDLPYGLLDVYNLRVIIRPASLGVGYNGRHFHQLLEG
jgi:hypothetical protein